MAIGNISSKITDGFSTSWNFISDGFSKAGEHVSKLSHVVVTKTQAAWNYATPHAAHAAKTTSTFAAQYRLPLGATLIGAGVCLGILAGREIKKLCVKAPSKGEDLKDLKKSEVEKRSKLPAVIYTVSAVALIAIGTALIFA